MANPAPIIIQIPAFNVEVGTTIDFNIIGGTNIVRSNKLYVYNLDNDLIFTHTYVSTESLHELPSKTDASIVYASGKTSNDFNNGNQYYAIIQTFTDIYATEGASGFSTAKLFWALPTPTLDINTIPASIDITSYNVSAVYDTNVNLSDINIIQQYQFDLYKSTGVLVQTSGVIVGSGTAVVGSNTQYSINYNFSGLEEGESYYVIATITTNQSWTISDTSSTFSVIIDVPTLGSATVLNSCDGYISITSNLSASYTSDITKILVKRLDVNDVTQTWLTLFSIDVESASDMNFTVIDYYNRYGKEYKYALVPIMVQNQGTVESPIYVEVEGRYTLSDAVDSYFDGVFIADNTAIHKLIADVDYSGASLRQSVGTIETIGNKYPVIVSNNSIQYYNGTISASIFNEAFYTNSANISRTDIVSTREEIAEFLCNKSPKILKDWNGNIWLIMFTGDVSFTFMNEYGMGIVAFSASWTEIGDAEDQYDLQNSGLIDIGGV